MKVMGELTEIEKKISQIIEALLYSIITREQAVLQILSLTHDDWEMVAELYSNGIDKALVTRDATINEILQGKARRKG